MRTRYTALMGLLVLVGLLLPTRVLARTVTVLGSATISGSASSTVVGVAVAHNPGFEKTVTVPIPPLTVPVFADVDKDNVTSHVVTSRFDTTLILTNTGAAGSLVVTVFDTAGSTLVISPAMPIAAKGTVTINISDLL